MIELVCFLGNPGPQYARTRHNAGWLVAARLPFAGELAWRKKFRGRYAERDGPPAPAGARLRFLMPELFMNCSGESAAEAASFYKIPVERILVVHDELELPLGAVALKHGGGLGGHNGLRSLKASLGSAEFWRLRFGVGRPGDRVPGQGGRPGVHGDIIGWVLSEFGPGERAALDDALGFAADLLVRALAAEPAPGKWTAPAPVNPCT